MTTYGIFRLHAHDLTLAARRCYKVASQRDIAAARREAEVLQRDLDDFVRDIQQIQIIISAGETVPE